MELLQDGGIAFLSAIGLASCVWLLAGALLGWGKCANGELLLILPVWDDAPALEADLRDLLRVRHSLPGATIVVEDRGLTEEARQLAQYLCRRYDNVELRPGDMDNMN